MENLSQKIDALFEYRMLPQLIKEGGANAEQAKVIYQKLKKLQEAIYNLDHYLETHWICTDLDTYWRPISNCLIQDFNIAPEDVESYLAHIRKYEKHELELRKNILPTRLDMEYFYFYKSCDVKLLRRLIYEAFPSIEKKYPLADWRNFDLVTEVNDDIEDIFEDLLTINGNRFLILVETEDINTATQTFSKFIKDIQDKNDQRLQRKGSAYQQVHSITSTLLEETLELLVKNSNMYSANYQNESSKLSQNLAKVLD